VRLREFLNILSLLFVLLSELLHLLPLNDQLVLEGSILGGIDPRFGFLAHEHVSQANNFIRVGL